MVDLVHPAIFSCQFPDTPIFTGLFLNFSGIQCDSYNNKPCVCKVLCLKFPKQPNRELAGKFIFRNKKGKKILLKNLNG